MIVRRKFWRIALRLLLVAVTALVLRPSAVAQPALTVIRFGAAADVHATPFLYAVHAGLYRKYGIDVQLIKFNNAAAATAALVGGSLDMSKTSILGMLNAVSRGLPLTILGSIGYYNADRPDHALIVMKNSSIEKAADLQGQTLAAISLQDMESIATFGWLEQQGIDHSKISYLEIPASATLAALEQGKVAGSTMSEPFLSANLSTGKVRILGYPYNAFGKHFVTAVIFAQNSWATEHQDLVARFLRATQEASAYVAAHEDSDDIRHLIAEYTGVDPDAIKAQRHPGRGVLLNPNDLQPIIDYAFRLKIIPKHLVASDIICSCALRR
jgi:NitT/TauT family transport system substrate-binding protein